MSGEQTTIIFRIDRELKEQFEAIAQGTERTVSQYLRAFIKDTINRHNQTHAIAPQSTNAPKPNPPPTPDKKTPPKLGKGQKLNRIPPRGNK